VLLPSVAEAEAMLDEAGSLNPGPWVSHSRYVARGARAIAEYLPGVDPEAAYIVGLLHDIGRRAGVTGMRHILDGYNYLMERGYEVAARVAISHSFANRHIGGIFGKWDVDDAELRFIEDHLARVEYDDYDRLIQLCDALAMGQGFVLMEKRMMDVALRYGTTEQTVAKWRATFQIKDNFERVMGCSIYSLLPGVVENTFEFLRAR
jgi:HD superfamily phosphohydrolase YqeK